MAITSIVDSKSLHDVTFEIKAGETKALTFSLPNDFVDVKDSKKPILLYTVLPLNSVKYEVRSNSSNLQNNGHLQELETGHL